MEYSLKGRREERENNNHITNNGINLLISLNQSQDSGTCGRKEIGKPRNNNIARKSCYCPVPGTVTIGSSLRQQLHYNSCNILSQSSSSAATLLLHGVTYLSLFWVTKSTTATTIIRTNSPFQPSQLSHNHTFNKQQHYHSFNLAPSLLFT